MRGSRVLPKRNRGSERRGGYGFIPGAGYAFDSGCRVRFRRKGREELPKPPAAVTATAVAPARAAAVAATAVAPARAAAAVTAARAAAAVAAAAVAAAARAACAAAHLAVGALFAVDCARPTL